MANSEEGRTCCALAVQLCHTHPLHAATNNPHLCGHVCQLLDRPLLPGSFLLLHAETAVAAERRQQQRRVRASLSAQGT